MSQLGNTPRPRRVIVSGGIGSGKTTVLGFLAARGAVVIEADRIGHEILAPGGAAFDAVAQRWPQVMIGGRIDRKRLAAIVFSDGEQLRALEAISHPLIAAEIERRVAAVEDRDVVLELPVGTDLVGEGWTQVVVTAPDHLRRQRAVQRGMSSGDVANRIAVQEAGAEQHQAEFTIQNTGSLADLEARVAEVWEMLAVTA